MSTAPKNLPPKIRYHLIKSNYFRSIHADGIFGGATPAGLIHMVLFSERPAIPTEMVHSVTAAGSLGDEIVDERVGRDGMVRELEADVFMSLDVAKLARQWLDSHIEQIEKLRGAE